MNSINENIELTLPVNSAYVSSVRLTASSIANRMQFNIDEIEDIKAAVSEACAFIIKNSIADVNTKFRINFVLGDSTLQIAFFAENMATPDSIDDEMGFVMIRALMDSFGISTDGPNLTLTLVKKHKADQSLM